MRTRQRLLTTLVVAALASAGCFAARGVRPVGKGKLAAGLSLGGPLFTNLGGAIPTPLVTGYARYGVTEATDVDVGITLPTTRTMALDAGASHQLFGQSGGVPAVSVGGRLNLWANPYGLVGKKDSNGIPFALDPELFEEAYSYASWDLGRATLGYVGLDLFAQLQDAIVRPSLLAGVEWRPTPLFGVQLQLEQMAFLSNQKFSTVSFIGPSNYGALALQLGFNFYPGASR